MQTVFAELCERALREGFTPAAALVDLNHQCLHFSGATSRYLTIAPGQVTHDLLRMIPSALRPRLRAALQRSAKDGSQIVVPGGEIAVDEGRVSFDVHVGPVAFGAETLLVVTFQDRACPAVNGSGTPELGQGARTHDRDLDAVRIDLQDALHEIDPAHEQQKIASEEALSIGGEVQSTNEELLTSNEELQFLNKELQSLNKELIVLNTQLREALARERATATDLQNVKWAVLSATIALLLKPKRPEAATGAVAAAASLPAQATVYVVDDDAAIRKAMRAVLESEGLTVADFASSEAFLHAYVPSADTCLIVDACLPGLSGVALLRHLREQKDVLPTIVITGSSDVPIAVEVMKAGAFDYIEKPVREDELLENVARALQTSRDSLKPDEWRAAALLQLSGLTMRQRQIMDLVLAGHPSKNIAVDLGISSRTVENHRAAIMRKTGSKSLPALARLAMSADRSKPGPDL